MNEKTRDKYIAFMILMLIIAGYQVISDLVTTRSQGWLPYIMGAMTGAFAGLVAWLALRNSQRAKHLFTIAALSIPVMCGLALFLRVDYFIVLSVATLLAIPLLLIGLALSPRRT